MSSNARMPNVEITNVKDIKRGDVEDSMEVLLSVRTETPPIAAPAATSTLSTQFHQRMRTSLSPSRIGGDVHPLEPPGPSTVGLIHAGLSSPLCVVRGSHECPGV